MVSCSDSRRFGWLAAALILKQDLSISNYPTKQTYCISCILLPHLYEVSESDYTLNGSTFEPTNIITSFSTWGLMGYNKPMNNNRYWKPEKLAEGIAGPKCSVNFSDPKEVEGFDRIGWCMT